MSLATIGIQGVLDAGICISHMMIAIVSDSIFQSFPLLAFLKLVVFSIFEFQGQPINDPRPGEDLTKDYSTQKEYNRYKTKPLGWNINKTFQNKKVKTNKKMRNEKEG